MGEENKTRPEPSEIAEWLRVAVSTKGAVLVELWRAYGGRPIEERLTLWENLTANDGNLDKVCAEMVRAAERDGQSVLQGQRVQYVLQASKSDRSYVDRLTVTVPSGAQNKTEAQGLEIRDAMQALSHCLSENTKLLATVIKAFDGRDESLVMQLRLMTDRCQALERDHSTTLAAQQKFVLFQMEQTQIQARIAREERRDAQLFEKLSLWAPLILNRLLGGGPTGRGAPAADLILDQLFSTFTTKDVDTLMGSPLSQDKKAAIGELYMSYMARKAAQAAQAEANGQGSGAPATSTPLNAGSPP